MVPFAVLLAASLLGPGVPERLPTHWSGSGVDGTASGEAFFSVALTITGLVAILAALVAVLSMLVPSTWSRWILSGLAALGAGAAAAYLLALTGTAQSGDPAGVTSIWGLAAVGVALLWGWVTYAVHSRAVLERRALVEALPERSRVVPVPVTQQDPTRWATAVRSRTLIGTAAFTVVVFTAAVALLLNRGDPVSAIVLGVLGMALSAFTLAWASIEITVDETGLTVRSAVVPVTLRTVPNSEVLGVQTADLDPMAWGGYGLRATPARTAYIVRGGPGIVVHRASGRPFALEIPEGQEVADAGARALRRSAGRALGSTRAAGRPQPPGTSPADS